MSVVVGYINICIVAFIFGFVKNEQEKVKKKKETNEIIDESDAKLKDYTEQTRHLR